MIIFQLFGTDYTDDNYAEYMAAQWSGSYDSIESAKLYAEQELEDETAGDCTIVWREPTAEEIAHCPKLKLVGDKNYGDGADNDAGAWNIIEGTSRKKKRG